MQRILQPRNFIQRSERWGSIKFRPDILLAIEGGSAIGLAKAVSINRMKMQFDEQQPPQQPSPGHNPGCPLLPCPPPFPDQERPISGENQNPARGNPLVVMNADRISFVTQISTNVNLKNKGIIMAIVKVIEVIAGSGKSFDDATNNALIEASKSVKNIKSIYVKEMKAAVENNKIVSYGVNAKVSFEIEND